MRDGILRARERGGDAALENRAALLALGVLLGHGRLGDFVGPLPVLKLNANDIDAAILAFRHVQRIRLLDQHRRLSRGEPADNLVATDSLNGLDRKFLVDSLKEARSLQFVLQKTFRLESL